MKQVQARSVQRVTQDKTATPAEKPPAQKRTAGRKPAAQPARTTASLAATAKFLGMDAPKGSKRTPSHSQEARLVQDVKLRRGQVVGQGDLLENVSRCLYGGSDATKVVSPEWIEVFTAVTQTLARPKAQKTFLAAFPGRAPKTAPALHAVTCDTVNGGTEFAEYLHHMTTPQSAFAILRDQRPMLSSGSRNAAAFCLGNSNFYSSNSTPKSGVTFLRCLLEPQAKVLDLTQDTLGNPFKGGCFTQYEWYVEEFLPRLKAGDYALEFPELTALAQASHYNYLPELASKEIFGHMLGAQILLTSEKYDWAFISETWVIDPGHAIKALNFEKGVTPEAGSL